MRWASRRIRRAPARWLLQPLLAATVRVTVATRANQSTTSFITCRFSIAAVTSRRQHILVVFLGASLYTLTATRIYESTVRILIERDNPKVVSFQEVIDPGEITDDYYETQYRILQSRVLARRTIDTMDLWTHPEFNQPPRMTIRGLIMTPVNKVAAWFEPPRPPSHPTQPRREGNRASSMFS